MSGLGRLVPLRLVEHLSVYKDQITPLYRGSNPGLFGEFGVLSAKLQKFVLAPCPNKPLLYWPNMGAWYVPEAAVLEGGVVDREPEPVQRQRLVVQEGSVLVGGHLPPYARLLEDVHSLHYSGLFHVKTF